MTSISSDKLEVIAELDRESGYPGYPSDPDPEKIVRLAGKHGIDPDYRFLQEMRFLAWRYELMSNLKFDTGKVKKQTGILAKKAKTLVKAIDEFEQALRGFDDLSENPAESPFWLRRDVKSQQKDVRLNAESWAKAANRALTELDAKGSIKKSVGDPSFTFLLKDLIQIFKETTGRKIGVSKDPSTEQYTGPMFRFINDCLDLLGIGTKTNTAVGRAIEKLIY